MLRTGLLALIILFAIKTTAYSQYKDSTAFGISTHPIYWFQNGLRVDAEARLAPKSRHWLVGGAMYYNGPVNLAGDANVAPTSPNKTDNEDKMSGYGFELQHKIFLNSKKYTNIYFAYGPVIKQYEINFQEANWATKNIDGVEFMVYDPLDVTQQIQQIGLTGIFGTKLVSSNNFVFDIYAGLGYKNSTVKAPIAGYREYKRDMWDFAYSGVQAVGGLKIGYFVKQKKYRKKKK